MKTLKLKNEEVNELISSLSVEIDVLERMKNNTKSIKESLEVKKAILKKLYDNWSIV